MREDALKGAQEEFLQAQAEGGTAYLYQWAKRWGPVLLNAAQTVEPTDNRIRRVVREMKKRGEI